MVKRGWGATDPPHARRGQHRHTERVSRPARCLPPARTRHACRWVRSGACLPLPPPAPHPPAAPWRARHPLVGPAWSSAARCRSATERRRWSRLPGHTWQRGPAVGWKREQGVGVWLVGCLLRCLHQSPAEPPPKPKDPKTLACLGSRSQGQHRGRLAPLLHGVLLSDRWRWRGMVHASRPPTDRAPLYTLSINIKYVTERGGLQQIWPSASSMFPPFASFLLRPPSKMTLQYLARFSRVLSSLVG